mgnify:CR=1 FL=1
MSSSTTKNENENEPGRRTSRRWVWVVGVTAAGALAVLLVGTVASVLIARSKWYSQWRAKLRDNKILRDADKALSLSGDLASQPPFFVNEF